MLKPERTNDPAPAAFQDTIAATPGGFRLLPGAALFVVCFQSTLHTKKGIESGFEPVQRLRFGQFNLQGSGFDIDAIATALVTIDEPEFKGTLQQLLDGAGVSVRHTTSMLLQG
jgi:hypothetical protein